MFDLFHFHFTGQKCPPIGAIAIFTMRHCRLQMFENLFWIKLLLIETVNFLNACYARLKLSIILTRQKLDQNLPKIFIFDEYLSSK